MENKQAFQANFKNSYMKHMYDSYGAAGEHIIGGQVFFKDF